MSKANALRVIIAASLATAALAAVPASAQSLFNQPLAPQSPPPPSAAAPAETAPAAAKPAKPRPKKPRGPVPARALTISNASPNALTSLEVSGDGKTARLGKPLAPSSRTTLKLPALKSCTVSVAATFEGSGASEASDFDICKEKTIRFVE